MGEDNGDKSPLIVLRIKIIPTSGKVPSETKVPLIGNLVPLFH